MGRSRSWAGSVRVVGGAALHAFTCVFGTVPAMVSAAFLVAVDKPILKLTCKIQGLRLAKSIFKKNNKVLGRTLYNFKTYDSVAIIKAVSTGLKTG